MDEVRFAEVETLSERQVKVAARLPDTPLVPRANTRYPWLRASWIQVSFFLSVTARTTMVTVGGELLYESGNVAEPHTEFWYDNDDDRYGIMHAPQWVQGFVRAHRPEGW